MDNCNVISYSKKKNFLLVIPIKYFNKRSKSTIERKHPSKKEGCPFIAIKRSEEIKEK